MKHNILIIGIGYHARRIYIPYIIDNKNRFNHIIGFDILSQKNIINKYLEKNKYNDLNIKYLKDIEKDNIEYVENEIINIIKKYNINMAIISTEPLYHNLYAKIILNENISILLDKPITLEENIINEPSISEKMLEDYLYLCKEFKKKSKKNKGLQFDIMAQRRYHNGYRLAKEKINEIMDITNCPITSIVSFHNDGQWRFPDEIIDQNYHPYNQGYGKLGHSGFHTIDIATWFIKSTSKGNKKIVSADIISFATFPNDLISQFNYNDYEKIFPGFIKKSKYTEKEFLKKSKNFGDVDVSSIIKFRNNNGIQSILSLNLGHNGFGQRSWTTVKGRDLYKGNGRIRQEFIMIEQGPFQSILIETFQSKEISKSDKNLYGFGGEQHFDIHIFRNSELLKNTISYEKITSYDLYRNIGKGYSRGHNEEARRNGISYFIENIENKNNYTKSLSNILDHDFSVKIFTSICKSISSQKKGENPIINIKL